MKELMKKAMKNGKTSRLNINYLMAILKGLKSDGVEEVELCVSNDYPVLINKVILVAPIVDR